jgi:hypothetical protein
MNGRTRESRESRISKSVTLIATAISVISAILAGLAFSYSTGVNIQSKISEFDEVKKQVAQLKSQIEHILIAPRVSHEGAFGRNAECGDGEVMVSVSVSTASSRVDIGCVKLFQK